MKNVLKQRISSSSKSEIKKEPGRRFFSFCGLLLQWYIPVERGTHVCGRPCVPCVQSRVRLLEREKKGGTLLQKRWFVPVGKPLLSRFPNRERQSGTKGGVLLSRVWQPGQKVSFFHVFFSQFFFYFNYTFAFQLNLCIGIQCVWSPLIYTYI